MTTYLVWEPETGADVDCANEVVGIDPVYAAKEFAARRHADGDYFDEASYLVLDTDSGELHAFQITVVPVPEFTASREIPRKEDTAELVVRGLILAAGGEPE